MKTNQIITTICPYCNEKHEFHDSELGKQYNCIKCKKEFNIISENSTVKKDLPAFMEKIIISLVGILIVSLIITILYAMGGEELVITIIVVIVVGVGIAALIFVSLPRCVKCGALEPMEISREMIDQTYVTIKKNDTLVHYDSEGKHQGYTARQINVPVKRTTFSDLE